MKPEEFSFILVHSAALSCSSCHSSVSCGIGLIHNQRFGGQDASCDGSSILQRGAGDLGGVNDAAGDHVAVFLGVGIVAVGVSPDGLWSLKKTPASKHEDLTLLGNAEIVVNEETGEVLSFTYTPVG